MLPGGFTKWKVEILEVTRDEVDELGKPRKETLEVWMWDPVECIRELVGNPLFKEFLHYEPIRVYADGEGKDHIYDNMWTGNWWWDTQVMPSTHHEFRSCCLQL